MVLTELVGMWSALAPYGTWRATRRQYYDSLITRPAGDRRRLLSIGPQLLCRIFQTRRAVRRFSRVRKKNAVNYTYTYHYRRRAYTTKDGA